MIVSYCVVLCCLVLCCCMIFEVFDIEEAFGKIVLC